MDRMIMRRTAFRERAASFGLFALVMSAPVLAAGAIPDGVYNAWLAERPVPQAPLFRARIAGVARYGHYESGATLAFSCRSDTAGVNVELALDPKPLAFDTDPYEGPDATVHGPIVITSGSEAATQHKVSGWYGEGGPFDTGTPFIFGFSLGMAQLKSWTAATTRGQSLRIEVPAPASDATLVAQFRWPDDDTVFQHVMAPCLH